MEEAAAQIGLFVSFGSLDSFIYTKKNNPIHCRY